MRRSVIGLVACAAIMASAATPAAAASYSFSYGFNGTTIASGVFTTDNTVVQPGAMNVASVTGSRMGVSFTGLEQYPDFGDQLIFPASATARVDGQGITYQIGAYSYNVSSAGNGFYNEFRYLTADSSQPGQGTFLSSFTLSPYTPPTAAVPEPASWAMAILGLGVAGASLRRRRPMAAGPGFAG